MTSYVEPQVVTIGGGTGGPVVLHALKMAGVKNIQAICAAMDSGGVTGGIRSDERDHVIAISNLLRNLLALIPEEHSNSRNATAFEELVTYKDGRQRNWGYLLYYAMLEKYNGDFRRGQGFFERLLGFRFVGTAIPVTL